MEPKENVVWSGWYININKVCNSVFTSILSITYRSAVIVSYHIGVEDAGFEASMIRIIRSLYNL